MAPALISGNAVVIKPAELTPLSATHLARALQRRRPARRRAQRGARRGPRGRRRAGPRPPRRRAVLHRLHRVGPRAAARSSNARARPGPAGDGRQERRTWSWTTPTSPQGRQHRGGGRVRAHRPGLHRDLAGLRHPGRSATAFVEALARGAPRLIRRRRARRRHHDGPGRERSRSWPRTCSAVRGAVGAAPRCWPAARSRHDAGLAVPGRRGHRPARPTTPLVTRRGIRARSWPCSRSPTTTPGSPRSTTPVRPHRRHLHRLPGALHDFAARAQVGVVKVNRPTAGLDLNVPFGGVKDSSTNTFREQGASPRWTSSPGPRPSTRVCSPP